MRRTDNQTIKTIRILDKIAHFNIVLVRFYAIIPYPINVEHQYITEGVAAIDRMNGTLVLISVIFSLFILLIIDIISYRYVPIKHI